MIDVRPLVVVAARTVIVLIFSYTGLRLLGRRHSGELHVGDILLILFLGNSVQNAMTTGSGRLGVALVSAGTLIAGGFLLNALFRGSTAIERRVAGQPIIIVHDGTIVQRNLRDEHVSGDELAELLRKQGVEDVADVKLAVLEPNGSFSVVRREAPERSKP